MKKWFTLILTLAAIGPLTLTGTLANSQDSTFPRGKVALQKAQFTPKLLPNGNYGLKANTGKYLARCRGCSPTAAATGNRDVVALAVLQGASPATRPFAQWNIISIPPEY